jgi:hypothetical protein
MTQQRYKPIAENDRISVYAKSFDERSKDLEKYIVRTSDKPALIIHEDGDNKFTETNLNNIIDTVTQGESGLVTLPSRFPKIRFNRLDYEPLIKDSRKGMANSPVIQARHALSPYYFEGDHEIERMCEGIMLGKINGIYYVDVTNAQDLKLNRPLYEAILLEGWFEHIGGPTIRTNHGPLQHDNLTRELLGSRDSGEIESLISQINTTGIDEDFVWNGLDHLYPNPIERVERMDEYAKKWFPEEFNKIAEAHRKSIDWLNSMRNEETR